jgi:putative MFS transporter
VFSDGYGLGIIGIALSQAPANLQLNPVWTGLLGGASLFGLFAGSLLTGPVADRFGRRPIFACNMALLAALSLLQNMAGLRSEILVLRLAIGFLLGTDYVVSKALLTEFTPRRLRGRIMGTLSIAWAGGYACAYFVGYALSDSSPHAWRWMLLTSALPCLCVLPLRLTVPESPLWLTNHGQSDKAADIVRKKLGAQVQPPLTVRAPPATRSRWRQLFSPAWRRRTLVGCTFFTAQVIPYFAFGTFISQVLSALHVKNGHVGGLVYNAALLGGAVAGLVVVDRISRRSFLIGSFCIAAGTMLLLVLWAPMPPLILSGLFAVFAGVLSAQSNLVYVYLPELFPTDLRASGIGLSIAASRIGSAVATFLLPVVVHAYGVRTAMTACVVILALGAVTCARWAPETRHLRLGHFDRTASDGDSLPVSPSPELDRRARLE